MKVVAFTGVYNESFFLPLWLNHYQKMVDDLYVIDSGTDDGSVEKAKEKYKFEILKKPNHVPGRFIREYGMKTVWEVQEQIIEFLKTYDWVIYAHIDEFIFPNPQKYNTLKDYIGQLKKEYVYCNGYDVLKVQGESSIMSDKPLLSQRKYWVTTDSYSKPLLTRVPLEFVEGFHYLSNSPAPEFMKERDLDLFLAHFARVDEELVRVRNPYRFNSEDKLKEWMIEKTEAKEYIPEHVRNIV